MSYRFATYEKRGRIAYVTLNRPEVMNALHLEAHLELAEIWEDFRDDPDVWVAILTGAGERAFSAGNDLKATAERTANGGDVQGDARPPFGRITRDFHCPKPMIAAVNGVAVGGGLEMALACDIIVAADHARFGLPEPRVGLFAGAGGIHRLARQLPFKVAMGLLLTGRLFGADEAHRIGLVNEVVPLADLMATAERWAGEILECSPLSVQLTKESAFDGLQHSVDDALAPRPRARRAAARLGRLRRGPEGVLREAQAAVDRALSLPLADLRVIDMADEKGEMCGRFLADLGADVIRVEPPGGARSRRAPLSFAVRNANKRGVTIDIETERERLLSLLESADVWIETTRPGTLAALGLGPDAVLARNPQLVITSITDFGQSGDYRDWQADDAIHAAMSGILSRSGLAGRDPLPAPRGMATETAAIQAAWATLVAYWNRLETGRGDHVDFSILEAATQTMDPAYGTASVSRASAFPSTRGRPEAGLYPIFPCADGHVRVVVLAPRQWRAMRAWLGEPAAFQDERFDAIPARLEAAAELHELYAALFAGLTKDAIAAEGQARGVPVAPVLGVADVLASPHFEARGAFVDAEVAPGVHGRLPSGFCEIDGARVGFRHRAPEPGEHDDDLGGAPRERPAWPAARPGRRPPCRAGRSPVCASSTSGSSSSATRSGACWPTRAPT